MRGIENRIQIFRAQDAGADLGSNIGQNGGQVDGKKPGLYANLDEIEAAWRKHETPDLPNREVMVNGIRTPLNELRRMCWVSGITIKKVLEPTSRGLVETEIDPWFPKQAPEELKIREKILHNEE